MMQSDDTGLSVGSRFFQNLFGIIGGGLSQPFSQSGMDFIPTDGNGNIARLTGQESVAWLGMRNKLMQKYAYDNCYPVAAIADRLAEYDISGCLEINRLRGKGAENPATNPWSTRMKLLLAQPNPLQNWEQFRGQQVMYKKVFGFCPVLAIIPAGMLPEFAVALINLPPWLFSPIRNKVPNFLAININELVDGWRVNIINKVVSLKAEDVFILEDSFMLDEKEFLLLPQSRLVGLDMAISNCCAAMEADNVLLRKKGPLGFVSQDAAAGKDQMGPLPLTKTQKRVFQNQLNRYGLGWGQLQYLVSRHPMKWVSMSYDTKQLGTKETIAASEKAICHRFAYPYVLYEEQDATYANGGNAKKGVFQDNVIPNSKKDFNKYNKFFLADENDCKIECDYSHVAAFQEDEKFKAQARQLNDQGLEIEFQNNVITLNQWRTQLGYDTTSDGDVYFKDIPNAQVRPTNQLDPSQPSRDPVIPSPTK